MEINPLFNVDASVSHDVRMVFMVLFSFITHDSVRSYDGFLIFQIIRCVENISRVRRHLHRVETWKSQSNMVF